MQQTQTRATAPATAEPVGIPEAPAAPPAAPLQGVEGVQGVVVSQGARGVTVQLPGGASPQAIYQAAKAKRSELSELMSRLRNRRSDLAQQLRRPEVSGVDRAGLEKHLAEVDARLVDMERQIQQADIEIATAAGIPGAVRSERESSPPAPYEDELGVGMGLGFVLLIPVVVAYTRRLWKRANIMIAPIPQMLQDRITRMEQSIDAIAVEVERVSEGQRFMTKLFADGGQRALQPAAAQPVELPVHETAARG